MPTSRHTLSPQAHQRSHLKHFAATDVAVAGRTGSRFRKLSWWLVASPLSVTCTPGYPSLMMCSSRRGREGGALPDMASLEGSFQKQLAHAQWLVSVDSTLQPLHGTSAREEILAFPRGRECYLQNWTSVASWLRQAVHLARRHAVQKAPANRESSALLNQVILNFAKKRTDLSYRCVAPAYSRGQKDNSRPWALP